MDLATIAQVVSAIGTVGLTVLFGFQLGVFYRQVFTSNIGRGVLVAADHRRSIHRSRTSRYLADLVLYETPLFATLAKLAIQLL